MSKKVKVEETAIAATPIPAFDLKAALEKYPNVSLRKLAQAAEISYGWVLKNSKKPIAGETYDPNAINYEAVVAVFTKRNIDLASLDWETLNEASLRKGNIVCKDMGAFAVGQKVWLREDNTTPFEICYMTDTHIVIMKEGTTEPRAWSHTTFMLKGPSFEPRAVSSLTDESDEEA